MSCIEYENSETVSFFYSSDFKCIVLKGNQRSPYEVSLSRGRFKIELWGASGASSSGFNYGGLGGYSSGIINLKNPQTFSFYVGTAGTKTNGATPGTGGYNGGSNGARDSGNNDCPSGGSGGATDMRIDPDISNRIIVAGGGGSAGCYTPGGNGGNSGGIIGVDGQSNDSGSSAGGKGGTQSSGYQLGQGEKGVESDEAGGSGGGGFYGGYGGKGGNGLGAGGGGGGSSFISGHPSCERLKFFFENPLTIPGNSTMPMFGQNFDYVAIGNSGNGAVRISTFVIDVTCGKQNCYENFYIFLTIFIF